MKFKKRGYLANSDAQAHTEMIDASANNNGKFVELQNDANVKTG